MFINLCRLAVVCTLCTCAMAVQYQSYGLVVGEGGYARLLTPAPSLSDLTLAGWVNITQFPYGVAPILTAVSPDARNQVAFFLRHDGVGVLWGGPPSVPQYHLDQVDRHPRTQWNPMENVSPKRQRRDAVDYSGGLGDIENIMGTSRNGRSFDTWTPYSFVDVDTMGVVDLEASPSGLNTDLHLLPTRDGFSRSESYNDWTNVPYELTMQESDPYDSHLLKPEPRIITQPSGADDFVLFNWNVPARPKPSIPQSPNEWSPMWQPNEDLIGDTVVQEEEVAKQPAEKIPWIDNPGWSSQVTAVKLGQNHWNPYGIRGVAFTSQRPRQQQLSTTTTTPRPRPNTTPQPQANKRTTVLPTRRTTVTRPAPAKPKTSRTTLPRITTPHSTLRWRTSKQPTTTTTSAPSTTTQQNKLLFNPSSLSIPKVTVTQRPYSREPNVPRKPASTTRQSTRMPLWKLIKQPNPSHPLTTKAAIETTTPTTTSTTTTTTSTTTTTTTTQRPTTSRPVTRKNLPRAYSSRFTTRRPRPRPSSTVRFTSQSEATDKPQISGQKSKVSIWSSTEDAFKQSKDHHHSEKWSDKSQGSANTVNKHRSIQITPYHVEEFHRAMEGLPTVKDGNTAVVYSVPITDVEAFNAMYQHYQSQSAPNPPPTTVAPTVIKKETAAVHEEETNENQLGENNLHLQDSLSYRFPGRPETAFQETVAPAPLTEEEAVLIPTEEPRPPTPSRSDIPITEDAIPIKTSEEEFEQPPKQLPLFIKQKQETTQDFNRGESTTIYESEKPQEPQIIRVTPSTSSPITQTTEKKEEISPSQDGVNDDIKQRVSEPELIKNPFYLDSKYTFNPTLEKEFLTETTEVDKPFKIIPAFSTVIEEKTQVPTTVKPQTIPTTKVPTTTSKRTPPIKTNAHSHPVETVLVDPEETVLIEDLSPLQSNNFAVFHISEDDIPYFPNQAKAADEVFSVDELYQPEGILMTQEDIHPVSHYQEPSHLYHQQLPPEYKYKAAPRPIGYSSPLNQGAETKLDDLDDMMFSADPQKFLEQGLLPQPVHYVSTQEEANQWMEKQYQREPQIEERVFAIDSADTINTTPEVSSPSKEATSQAGSNFHFRKLPFDFLENNWYHLAFTWSSQNHQVGVYINGELAGTLTDVLPGQLALAGGGLTILGQTLLPDLTDFDPTSQFIGEMSDINMWGQRLESEAVRALYQCRAQMAVTPALSWQQLSMRFYGDVYIQESNVLCGA